MKDPVVIAKKVYGCDPMEKTRREDVVWARRSVYVYMREVQKFTLYKISSRFNNNHATVVSGLSKHRIEYGSDAEYTSMFNRFCIEIGMKIPKEGLAFQAALISGESKNQVLVDMVRTVPDDLVEGIRVKLEAIIYMSKVKHEKK